MKVVVVGSGAREDAIAALYHRSGATVVCIPGNVGTERWGERLKVSESSWEKAIVDIRPDTVVIGGETHLCAGIADVLRKKNIEVVGPGSAAAAIEGSKMFGKEIAREADIPIAPSPGNERAFPYYLKYDGLAAGKGTFLITNQDDLREAKAFVTANPRSGQYHLEVPLEGTEFSSFLHCRQNRAVLLGHAMDFKRLDSNLRSPMTGGMASISPHPRLAAGNLDKIALEWAERTLSALERRGIVYEGILYLGGIMTAQGPFLLEYNCRLGDPEAQSLLSRFDLEDTGDPSSLRETSSATHAALVVATQGYPHEKSRVIIAPDRIESLAQSVTVYFGAGAEKAVNGYSFEGGRILTVIARNSADVRTIREFCSTIPQLICRFDVLYPETSRSV